MDKPEKGILYLIPTSLGEGGIENSLVPQVKALIDTLKHYIVEDEKTARKSLKEAKIATPQSELKLYQYDKKTPAAIAQSYMKVIESGTSMGLLSEAGCPAVADPGADLVRLAHQKGIRVVPLVGASSILLSLMASGFNGQNFAFVGYLPIDRANRIQRIKELERRAKTENQTQLFIETPYRNNQMLGDILKTCAPETELSISCNLTTPQEYICTQSIAKWRANTPDLHKQPAMFLIYSR